MFEVNINEIAKLLNKTFGLLQTSIRFTTNTTCFLQESRKYPLTSAASRCWTENQRWLMSLVH